MKPSVMLKQSFLSPLSGKTDMWTKPSEADLKQEYFVEIELKGNNFFDSEEAFLQAAS